jgi:hypothetical protein
MKTNPEVTKQYILHLLSRHRGRANAITRDEFLFELQAVYPEITDRAMRDMYSELPVCSTASKPYGLWLPTTGAEIQDFLREYSAHVGPIRAAARRQIFMRAYPKLMPDERQAELPF